MSTTFHQVKRNPAENRAILSEGVQGVRCISASSLVETSNAGFLTTRQLDAIQQIEGVLGNDSELYIGTVEVYDNGAMNLFVKARGNVVGYVTWRP